MTFQKKPKEKTVLPVDNLCVGLFIDLGLPWSKHPFLFRRFLIESEEQIQVIRSLTDKVIHYPHKSRAKPATSNEGGRSEPESASTEDQQSALWKEKKHRVEQARAYRTERRRLAERYRETSKRVHAFNNQLNTSPANAIHNADEIIGEMAASFDSESSVLINLVNLGDWDSGEHTHALNVTVLALSLAKAAGYSGEELRAIGFGALIHDIGKNQIPGRVRYKKTKLTDSEQKLLETHPQLGVKQVQQIFRLSPTVEAIIGQHHELLDGSGFPQGLRGEAISREPQLISICNIYDNLCNPPDPEQALSPKAAMAQLYGHYMGLLDADLIQKFIRTMGVYPPGTLVELSDGSVGVVLEIDSGDLLNPRVLLYNPDLPRNEALEVDLRRMEQLKVTRALRAHECPENMRVYLGMKQQIGYYFREGGAG